MPGLHFLGVSWHTWFRFKKGKGSDRVSTSRSTPVLILDNGKCICDSGLIVKYVSEQYGDEFTSLYPNANVEEWEQLFHDKLGPDTRLLAYYHIMNDPNVIFGLCEKLVSPFQARMFRRAYPKIRPRLYTSLGVSEKRSIRSMSTIRSIFEEVNRALEDGRSFLTGDRFTAADLTFASLASPVLAVSHEDGYATILPDESAFSEEFSAFVDECRSTLAGQFAQRLFREERGVRQIPYTFYNTTTASTLSVNPS